MCSHHAAAVPLSLSSQPPPTCRGGGRQGALRLAQLPLRRLPLRLRLRQPGPRLRKLTPHSLQLRSPLLGSPLPLSKARLQAPPLLRRLPGCSGPQPHGSAA